MDKIVVVFQVSVIVDRDEEREYGVDLLSKLNRMLAEMENIGAREYEVYFTTFDIEDY